MACFTGGEGEIRTPEALASLPVFKTGAFNRSATSPFSWKQPATCILPRRAARARCARLSATPHCGDCYLIGLRDCVELSECGIGSSSLTPQNGQKFTLGPDPQP